MGAVKIVTNKPGPAPKATEYAQIDNQGRIPYGKAQEVNMNMSMKMIMSKNMNMNMNMSMNTNMNTNTNIGI